MKKDSILTIYFKKQIGLFTSLIDAKKEAQHIANIEKKKYFIYKDVLSHYKITDKRPGLFWFNFITIKPELKCIY